MYVADLVSNKRISILDNYAVADENQDDSMEDVIAEYIRVVADARYYGNDSRFINHSCYPNARMF